MRALAHLAPHPCLGPRMRPRARAYALAARRAERQARSAALSCRPSHSLARSARNGPKAVHPRRTSPMRMLIGSSARLRLSLQASTKECPAPSHQSLQSSLLASSPRLRRKPPKLGALPTCLPGHAPPPNTPRFRQQPRPRLPSRSRGVDQWPLARATPSPAQGGIPPHAPARRRSSCDR
eukprot:12451148-Alexandrium_andersonii.AAC.1